jgi:hypothetical protein
MTDSFTVPAPQECISFQSGQVRAGHREALLSASSAPQQAACPRGRTIACISAYPASARIPHQRVSRISAYPASARVRMRLAVRGDDAGVLMELALVVAGARGGGADTQPGGRRGNVLRGRHHESHGGHIGTALRQRVHVEPPVCVQQLPSGPVSPPCRLL